MARTAPIYDLTAPDGIAHTVWKVTGDELNAVVSGFATLPALYIADGHHRAASAARARKTVSPLKGSDGAVEADWFLAVAFPDNQTQILPYNRVVRDLAGKTPESFLAEVSRRDSPCVRAARHPRRNAARRRCISRAHGTRSTSAARRGTDVVSRLDCSILQDHLLDAVLGIADVRTDKRVDFVGGIRGTSELEKLVNSGKFAVAFSLFPVGVGELMDIADAGQIMPPKSTWFEPKLRDALLIHTI